MNNDQTLASALDQARLDEPVSNIEPDTEELLSKAESTGEGDVDHPGESGFELAADATMLASVRPTETGAVEQAPDTEGLRSAIEVSYDIVVPTAQTESVIGTDGRVRISPANRYPWRVNCSLLITARDGSQWIGTAFFIGPRVLATAGHNLFFHSSNQARQGWARSIQVMPGRDGNSLPYGSATTSRFASVRGWTVNGPDPDYDYGVIILDDDDRLGSRTGWFGFGSYSDSTLRSSYVNISGYPGDRGNGREQWYMGGRVQDVSDRQVFYEIDTFGGQSGSAVYRIVDGARYAVGIHAYGTGGRPYNAATRINRSVFDNLQAWKNAYA